MKRWLLVIGLLLASDAAHAQTACSATCRACGSSGSSGAGGAPTDAQYVVASANGDLSAERVCTDTATIDCDAGTAGQMKFNLITPIRVATGCATPNFSFTDDTGAGLCLNGADDIQLQTTPTASSGTVLRLANAGGVYLYTYDSGNANGFNIGGAAHDFRFVLNGGTVFVLDNTLSTGLIAGKGSNPAVARSIAAGTGIAVSNGDGQSGNPTVGADLATTPQWASGTADPPATCTLGVDWYIETDTGEVYYCRATNTWDLVYTSNTVVAVADGGTGLSSGTSGGVLAYTAAGTLASSGALTQNLPVIGGGAGAAPTVGTRSGNTTAYVTTTGAQTSGDCVEIDASGNHVASGAACGGEAAAFDPGTTLEIYDDMFGGDASDGRIGNQGLRGNPASGGTIGGGFGLAAHPGTVRLSSHASNDNSGYLVSFGNGLSEINNADYTSHDWSFDVVLIPGANSTAITNAAWYVGVVNAAEPSGGSRGIWIRRDSDRSDTTYMFQICNASGAAGCAAAGDDTNSKTVASTITPVAGTANRFRIRRATSGVGGNPTYYFRVNDETEKTFCSSGCDDTLGTLPSTDATFGVFYGTRTTTGVLTGELDYIYLRIPGLARY